MTTLRAVAQSFASLLRQVLEVPPLMHYAKHEPDYMDSQVTTISSS